MMAPKPHYATQVKSRLGFPMYAIIESSESLSMRRHRRRPAVFSFLAGLRASRHVAAMSVSLEADRLEALYGEAAVAHVREQVQGADRKGRQRLYRLHDELARRQRRQESGDEFAGLMA
jgi:hypothetical protein